MCNTVSKCVRNDLFQKSYLFDKDVLIYHNVLNTVINALMSYSKYVPTTSVQC